MGNPRRMPTELYRQNILAMTEEEVEDLYPGSVWIKYALDGKRWITCMHNDPNVIGYSVDMKRKPGVSQREVVDNPERFSELVDGWP